MTTTTSTKYFSSNHAMRGVQLLDDFPSFDFSVKTRPTTMSVKFRIRTEQNLSTSCTCINTFFEVHIVLPCIRSFRSSLSQNIILLFGQLSFPFFIRLIYFELLFVIFFHCILFYRLFPTRKK